MLRLNSLILLVFLALCVSCSEAEDIEGNEPGECTDGADNDSDGYFDCNDSNCYGAPDCLDDGDDDDAAGDDDDATGDDDDATGDDDDATGDDDDASGDDDDSQGGDGVTPYISTIGQEWLAASSQIRFSVEAHDPDANFGVPLLLWSVEGQSQTPQSIGDIPLGADCYFDIDMEVPEPGGVYSVLFAIRDVDGNVSEGYLVEAEAF